LSKSKLITQLFPELAKQPLLKERIAELCEIQHLPKGTVFLKEGAYIKVIPLLISGLVKVYKEDEEGHEVLLYYIQPGESCIMSLTASLNNESSKVKGVIEEDSEALLLPASQVSTLGKEFPLWNEFVYNLYNTRFDELLSFVKLITFSNKDKLLLEYLHKESSVKNTYSLAITHQKIANELGTSREVISRLLKKLEQEGIVQLGSGKINLLK
jgi:CRP/FNR family transcriptional regulator